MLFWVSDFPQSSTNDAKLKQVSPKLSPEEDVSFGGTLDIGRLRESEEGLFPICMVFETKDISMRMFVVWKVGSFSTDLSFVFEYTAWKNQVSVRSLYFRP